MENSADYICLQKQQQELLYELRIIWDSVCFTWPIKRPC